MKEALEKYLKQKIVIDTRSSLIYMGVLENILEDAVELSDVDVHENKDTTSTKEVYVMESSKSGIIPNRNKVFVNMDFIVSFSLLSDIKCF
jgi:small nuclear ribonucleoprotein (snRNP)-like protein